MRDGRPRKRSGTGSESHAGKLAAVFQRKVRKVNCVLHNDKHRPPKSLGPTASTPPQEKNS